MIFRATHASRSHTLPRSPIAGSRLCHRGSTLRSLASRCIGLPKRTRGVSNHQRRSDPRGPWVSSTSTDADWVVKLVDEYPGRQLDSNRPIRFLTPTPVVDKNWFELALFEDDFAMALTRRFRWSRTNPFRVRLELSDICHSFQPGIG